MPFCVVTGDATACEAIAGRVDPRDEAPIEVYWILFFENTKEVGREDETHESSRRG